MVERRGIAVNTRRTEMRFMSIVKATRESEAGMPPSPALIEAIGKLAQEEMKDGSLVEMGGLLPSSTATRVRTSGGKVIVTDGPFAELKEIVGGYAVFELPSKEEAVERAKRFMQLHLDVLGPAYEGECEVRPMYAAGEACSQQPTETGQVARSGAGK
jgi:hypothetical protein